MMQSAQITTRDEGTWRRVGVLAQWWEGKNGRWHGWEKPPQKPKAKKGPLYQHPSVLQQPLEQVIHAANVMIRACEINTYRIFEILEDADLSDGDDMLAAFLSNPPQSFGMKSVSVDESFE